MTLSVGLIKKTVVISSECQNGMHRKNRPVCASVCALPSVLEVKRLKSEGRTDIPQVRLRADVHVTVAEVHVPSEVGTILRTRPIDVEL